MHIYVPCAVSTVYTNHCQNKRVVRWWLNQLLRNDGDKKNIAGNTNFYCTWNGYIFLSTTLAQLLDKYFNQLQWSRWSFWYVLLYTCRYRRGKSPLVRAPGMASGSSTLVRNASLPSLVHPIHVPPPSTSLPPRIIFEPFSPPSYCLCRPTLVRRNNREALSTEHPALLFCSEQPVYWFL